MDNILIRKSSAVVTKLLDILCQTTQSTVDIVDEISESLQPWLGYYFSSDTLAEGNLV